MIPPGEYRYKYFTSGNVIITDKALFYKFDTTGYLSQSGVDLIDWEDSLKCGDLRRVLPSYLLVGEGL